MGQYLLRSGLARLTSNPWGVARTVGNRRRRRSNPGKGTALRWRLQRTPLNQGLGGEHPGQFAFPNCHPGAAPQQKSQIGAGEHGACAPSEPIEPKPGAAALTQAPSESGPAQPSSVARVTSGESGRGAPTNMKQQWLPRRVQRHQAVPEGANSRFTPSTCAAYRVAVSSATILSLLRLCGSRYDSRPLRTAASKGVGIKSHRVGGRKSRLTGGCLARLARRPFAQVVGIEGDADHAGGMNRGADRFIQPDVILSGGIRSQAASR